MTEDFNSNISPDPQNNDNDRNADNYSNDLQPKISPIAAGFIGLFGGFFLYQFVGGLLTLLIFGLNIEKAPVNSFRLMTMGGQILFILLPALLFSKWFYEDVTRVIRFKSAKITEIGLFILGIIILTPMLENYISIQNHFLNQLAAASPTFHNIKSFFDSLNDKLESTYASLLSIHSVPGGFLVVLVVAVVPAICEETMFRGFIQKSFELKWKPFWAILMTAVFFGLYHFSPYGLIPLIALGAYFGFAVYMSDSIFVSMTLHFINNFVAVMVFFFTGNQDITDTVIKNGDQLQSSITSFFILLALFIGLIFTIISYYRKKQVN